MKRVLAVLTLATGVAACGGIDRDGTRDNIVENYQANNVDLDPDCVDAALDAYSDDQLEAIDDDTTGDSADSQELRAKIDACVTTTT